MSNTTIKEVGRNQAKQIINTRQSIGKYWLFDFSGKYIGLDNSSGEAWMEEFDTKQECIEWLEGKFQTGDKHD